VIIHKDGSEEIEWAAVTPEIKNRLNLALNVRRSIEQQQDDSAAINGSSYTDLQRRKVKEQKDSPALAILSQPPGNKLKSQKKQYFYERDSPPPGEGVVIYSIERAMTLDHPVSRVPRSTE
jgi:hypothetical protein